MMDNGRGREKTLSLGMRERGGGGEQNTGLGFAELRLVGSEWVSVCVFNMSHIQETSHSTHTLWLIPHTLTRLLNGDPLSVLLHAEETPERNIHRKRREDAGLQILLRKTGTVNLEEWEGEGAILMCTDYKVLVHLCGILNCHWLIFHGFIQLIYVWFIIVFLRSRNRH